MLSSLRRHSWYHCHHRLPQCKITVLLIEQPFLQAVCLCCQRHGKVCLAYQLVMHATATSALDSPQWKCLCLWLATDAEEKLPAGAGVLQAHEQLDGQQAGRR